MSPLLTVCLGYRLWYPEHLRNCLESLRAMDYGRERLEIVVVDTGPDAPHEAVRSACHVASALLVHRPQPVWSRSYALNAASRYSHANAKWLVFTDADMVFPFDWLKRVEKILPTLTTAIALTRSRDLPDGLDPSTIRVDPDWLLGNSTPHPDTGMGGGMIVRKDWFRRVRGFDETYKVWGCEDNDLVERGFWDNQPIVWVSGAFVAHQWHRRDWPTAEQYAQVGDNRQYYYKMQRMGVPVIVRNFEGWAGDLQEATP